MYFYEGRTVRGVGWMSWGLLTHLAGAILSAASTVLLFLSVGSLLLYSPSSWPTLAAALAVVCGLLVVELAALVLYLVGFHSMYAGRHEYGLNQDRNMERALVLVILAIVFAVVQSVSPLAVVFGGMAGPASTNLALSALGIAAQTASALLAGLALMYAVTGFADRGQRTRLLVGIGLGALGAFAGTTILLFGTLVGGTTGSPFEAVAAGALAGSGTSAISLFVFFLVYREVRRKLEMGIIAPAVPMFPPIWLYGPPIPYPAPQAPAAPATPPPASPPRP